MTDHWSIILGEKVQTDIDCLDIMIVKYIWNYNHHNDLFTKDNRKILWNIGIARLANYYQTHIPYHIDKNYVQKLWNNIKEDSPLIHIKLSANDAILHPNFNDFMFDIKTNKFIYPNPT